MTPQLIGTSLDHTAFQNDGQETCRSSDSLHSLGSKDTSIVTIEILVSPDVLTLS